MSKVLSNAAPTRMYMQILQVCNKLVHEERAFKVCKVQRLGLIASNVGIAAVFTKLCQGNTFERSVCGIMFTTIGMMVVVRAALQKHDTFGYTPHSCVLELSCGRM